jgi:hypothetical protein
VTGPTDRAAALVRTIDAAFARLPYPGDDRIVPSEYDRDGEARRILRLLRGWHWRDLPFDRLVLLKASLSWLTPEAYRFYLPAFMVFPVVDFETADVLPDGVISTLTEPRESDVDDLRVAVGTAGLADTLGAAATERLLAAQETFHRSGAALDAFRARVAGFDPAQRAAIRAFLEHMRDEYGAGYLSREPQVALDRYWEDSG